MVVNSGVQMCMMCAVSLLPTSVFRPGKEKELSEASWEPELGGGCVALRFYRQEGETWFMATTNLGLYTPMKAHSKYQLYSSKRLRL